MYQTFPFAIAVLTFAIPCDTPRPQIPPTLVGVIIMSSIAEHLANDLQGFRPSPLLAKRRVWPFGRCGFLSTPQRLVGNLSFPTFWRRMPLLSNKYKTLFTQLVLDLLRPIDPIRFKLEDRFSCGLTARAKTARTHLKPCVMQKSTRPRPLIEIHLSLHPSFCMGALSISRSPPAEAMFDPQGSAPALRKQRVRPVPRKHLPRGPSAQLN